MHADVVVVGGGLAAAALAYRCARMGLHAWLVSDSRIGGAGATAASRGIVRLYDPDPALMAWNVQGLQAWRELERDEGVELKRCGVLYFLSEANAVDARRRVAELGLDTEDIEVLPQAEVSRRFSALRIDGPPSALALYEARSGYCDPMHAASTLAQAVRRLGGTVLEGAAVTSVRDDVGGVCVSVDGTELLARSAVIAAGASSGALMGGLGLTRKTITLTGLLDPDAVALPCIIDEVAGCYTRPGENAGYVYCGGAGLYDIDAEPAPVVADLAVENLRRLARIRDTGALSLATVSQGTDAYTPDFHPRLGFIHPHSRIGVMTGFSGRGAKYIPAAAHVVALAVGQKLGGAG